MATLKNTMTIAVPASMPMAEFIALAFIAESRETYDILVKKMGNTVIYKPYGNLQSGTIAIDNVNGLLEVMRNPVTALNEEGTNVFDALVSRLREEGILDNHKTPSSALNQVASVMNRDNVGAFFFVDYENEKKRTNKLGSVYVVDKATGINPNDMNKTIVSVLASHKASDPLSIGTYHMGGSTSIPFSGVKIVLTRHMKSNMVGFAAVVKNEKYGYTKPVYETLYDKNGQIIAVSLSDLEQAVKKLGLSIKDPSFFTAKNYSSTIKKTIILSKNGGTTIKHIDYDTKVYRGEVGFGYYTPLQEENFGIPITSKYFDSSLGGKGIMRHLSGLRFRLNDIYANPKGPAANRVNWKINYSITANNIPISKYGTVSITVWIGDKKSKINNKNVIIEGSDLTSCLWKPKSSIIITSNGQKMASKSDLDILKDANMPYLKKNIIVEIVCDGIDPKHRGNVFQSTREDVKDEFFNDLRKELIKYLTSDDNILIEHDKLRKKSLKDSSAVDVNRIISTFGSIVDNPIMGSLMSTKAFDTTHSNSGNMQRHNSPKQIVTSLNPTYIKITRKTYNIDKTQEWFTIETDADDSFDNDVLLTFPNVDANTISVISTKPLKDGRKSFLVAKGKNAKNGDSTTVMAMLKFVNGTCFTDIKTMKFVICSSTKNPKTGNVKGGKDSKSKIQYPKGRFTEVNDGFNDINWDKLEADEVTNKPETSIAFSYLFSEENGEKILDIFININFSSLVLARNALEQIHGTEVADSYYKAYKDCLWFVAWSLECSGGKYDEISANYHLLKSVNAQSLLTALWKDYDKKK